MSLKIVPMETQHLGGVRWLFSMMVIEHLSKTPYPVIDEEEVDNFVLVTFQSLTNPYAGNWAAVRGKKVVGFICCEVQSRAVGKPNLFTAVHWLYVHPKHRELGIADSLLQAAVDWSVERGISHGEWCAVPGDEQWDRRGVPLMSTRYAIPCNRVADLFALPAKVRKIGVR